MADDVYGTGVNSANPLTGCVHRAEEWRKWLRYRTEQFATGGSDGTLRIYDAASLRLDVLCLGHGAEINGLVWHGGDERVTSVDRSGSIRAWVTSSGIEQWSHSLDGVVAEPCLSKDGARVLAGSFGGDVVSLDADSGEVLRQVHLEGVEVNALGISPDGKALFVGAKSGVLIHLDAVSLMERARFPRHTDRVSAIRFTPDGSTMVTSSFERTLAFSGPRSLASSRRLDLGGEGNSWYTDAIDDAAISPDGRLIAVASHSGLVRLVSVETGDLVLDLSGHRRWVRRVKFSPDGRTLLSTESQSAARVWDDQPSRTREASRAARLEMEAAARARIEATLGHPMTDPDDFEEALHRLPEVASAHAELGRAATAVIHQARSASIVADMTRQIVRRRGAADAKTGLAYLHALERERPLEATELCMGAAAHWVLGANAAGRRRLSQVQVMEASNDGVTLLVAALQWRLEEGSLGEGVLRAKLEEQRSGASTEALNAAGRSALELLKEQP